MLEDLNAEIQADEALDEELRALEDEIELVDFTLSGQNGSVLTLETEDDDNIHPLKKVYAGQKVELIPNPRDGYKLRKQRPHRHLFRHGEGRRQGHRGGQKGRRQS